MKFFFYIKQNNITGQPGFVTAKPRQDEVEVDEQMI